MATKGYVLTDENDNISGFGVRVGSHIAPGSLTLNTGTSADTVSDVQVANDGNTYNLAEVSGVPGFDLEFNFTNISNIVGFAFKGYYVGSSMHFACIDLYNYDTTQWDTFITYENSNNFNYRYIDIPFDVDYIDGGGNAKVRVYHAVSGNAAHDFYIDYVALVT